MELDPTLNLGRINIYAEVSLRRAMASLQSRAVVYEQDGSVEVISASSYITEKLAECAAIKYEITFEGSREDEHGTTYFVFGTDCPSVAMLTTHFINLQVERS